MTKKITLTFINKPFIFFIKNNYFFLLLLLVGGALTACKKDSTNTNNNTPTDYYITFDFDGTPIEYRTTSYQVNRGSGATVSGGIVNIGGGPVESIYVNINMDKDSITYNDLQALVGQQLEVCLSSSSVCNSPVHINLRYDDGTEVWSGDRNNNTAPMQSLTITKVEYSPTIGLGIGQLIIVTGEFDLILDNNSSVTKTASGGEFRLQFPEYR